MLVLFTSLLFVHNSVVNQWSPVLSTKVFCGFGFSFQPGRTYTWFHLLIYHILLSENKSLQTHLPFEDKLGHKFFFLNREGSVVFWNVDEKTVSKSIHCFLSQSLFFFVWFTFSFHTCEINLKSILLFLNCC